MHELGLLTSVVKAVDRAAAGRRVLRVALLVGTRSGAVPDSLYAAWPIANLGTSCAAAVLEVEEVIATVWCPACADEQEIDEFFALSCPSCGTPTADLRRGREFEVQFIEIDT